MQSQSPKIIKHIAFIASSSSGHIIPLITINNKMRKNENIRSTLITGSTDLEKHIIEKNRDYFDTCEEISLNRLSQGASIIGKILYGLKLFFYIFFFFFFLYKHRVDEVYLTGTYIALPAAIASKILSIPVNLYTLDVVPGESNKLVSWLATYNYVCFDKTKEFLKYKKNIVKTNYPIRFDEKDLKTKQEACKKLSLDSSKRIIFIVGGSQGSYEINSLIIQFIKANKKRLSDFIFIHQTGASGYESISAFYKENHINGSVFDYSNDFASYYSAADYIISRAGAGSIAEAIFFNKKTLLIPLKESGGGHQILNAESAHKEYKNFDYSLNRDQALLDTLNLFIFKNEN